MEAPGAGSGDPGADPGRADRERVRRNGNVPERGNDAREGDIGRAADDLLRRNGHGDLPRPAQIVFFKLELFAFVQSQHL